MAKMHSRKRGKSGSKRPSTHIKPGWMRYKPKEIELLVVKLAKEGKQPSQIGLVMRDTYGIPDIKAAAGNSVTGILKEKALLSNIPEDLMALIKKSVRLQKHLDANKHDMPVLRGFQLTQSKIKRLVKYYKRSERLPVEWKYDPKSVSLYVE
ncbi:30S ribosomal protein S15 [Candidatus Woesearchaeota archaeon]|nr:30S ribosomal protein S15 [Candidatus Woesearchaeota archaeon]